MAYAMHRGQVTTASGLDVLAAIWLIISPWVIGFGWLGNAASNNVILGIIIGILALIRFMGAYDASWLSWINALLGLWVLLSPWILRFANHRAPEVNNIITGAVIIVLAAWSAMATDTTRGEYRRDDFYPTT